MKYWKGSMDWPLEADWECPTCENKPMMIAGLMVSSGLTWGVIHGQCRCQRCHTRFRMRDREGNVVTCPISEVLPVFVEPMKRGWKLYQTPVSQWTKDQWKPLFETKEEWAALFKIGKEECNKAQSGPDEHDNS